MGSHSSGLLVGTRVGNREWVRANSYPERRGLRNLYVKGINWKVQK